MTSFGRVILVRGSLARVGLLASGPLSTTEVRATVGRFISIRCATSTIVAMITDVSCEDLPSSDNYIASAGVDLLGEILGGLAQRQLPEGDLQGLGRLGLQDRQLRLASWSRHRRREVGTCPPCRLRP